MSREELHTLYSDRSKRFSEEIRRETRRINLLSIARLFAVTGLIWLIVLAIQREDPLYFLFTTIPLILFLALVTSFNKHRVRRNHFRQLLWLNQSERSCLKHDFDAFADGAAHIDPSHTWSYDLDIFGKGSLFQYLNRTSTLRGADLLAGYLTEEPDSAVQIRERQEMVGDLKERIDFRQNFTARGRMLEENKNDIREISGWLSQTPYIRKYPVLFYLALLISLASLTVITAAIFQPELFTILLLILIFNFLVLSPFLARTGSYQSSISRKHQMLEGYAELLKIMASAGFSHPVWMERAQKASRGMEEVKRLSRLLNLFDQRLSMLLGVIFNGLFLFDFIMLYLLENWKDRNREEILGWIESVGQTDAMISLAGFAFNHPGFVTPEMPDQKEGITRELEFRQLGHPLIPDAKRVDNDLSLGGEKVVVITGANMAGKSTFLRSVGVNMVLAYAGCPVCATRFRTGFARLRSSMRTADSLKDEESYFMAEIRKLHHIVSDMDQGKSLLILLDEVLKGTNTTDKKRGSVGLIRRMIRHRVCCLIATHDLSLGELEKEYPGQVVSHCFESFMEGMELRFDYQIRPGIATHMNASFLMKKMGILD